MADEINLGGAIYVSSKRAASLTGYAQDYVGQLARSGAIEARRVSGLWYILQDSILKHKEKSDEFKPEPPERITEAESEVSVSFDGNDYISARRASEITGYTQDYVGQLARSGKILSRQIGNRWFVDRTALIEHKKEKDSLLASVQRDAVGLAEPEKEQEPQGEVSTHFQYFPQEVATDLSEPSEEETIIEIKKPKPIQREEVQQEPELIEEINQIPIRVVSPAQTSLKAEFVSTRAISFQTILWAVMVSTALGALIFAFFYVGIATKGSEILRKDSFVLHIFQTLFSKTLEYSRD